MNQTVKIPDGLITKFSIFNSLKAEDKDRLVEMAELKSVNKNVELYRTGHKADCIFFLVKGSIKLSTVLPDNREVVKQILYPLAMFGEQCLTGETHRNEYACSLDDDTQYFMIRAEEFHFLMRDNYALTRRILEILGKRLTAAQEKFESLIHKDARTRIIDFLRESAQLSGRKVGFETLLKHALTQQDIASLTGTSRQTVTAVLNELRKTDKIYFNRRSILIRDLATLS